MATCAYCNHDVEDETLAPAVGDDATWDMLAAEHAPNCEWIETRAHRRGVAGAEGYGN